MKIPRDISGRELVSLLGRYGYREVRRSGSHITLEKEHEGRKHTITVPDHKVLKVGKLNGITKVDRDNKI